VTSQINFNSINENFPLPGQDNDTEVFRNNFDTIKTNFREAKSEIEDLQANSARTDVDNNYNLKIQSNAVYETARDKKWDYGGVSGELGIEFGKGHYQILRATGNLNLVFKEFPGDPELPGNTSLVGAGRVRLEIYGDNTIRTITFNQPFGTVIKRSGFPGSIFTVSSTSNPVILDVWRHNQEIVFIRYVGLFE
jgi:hypothetical protein